MEIDHEIFSMVILFLPRILEGLLPVPGKLLCSVLVNHHDLNSVDWAKLQTNQLKPVLKKGGKFSISTKQNSADNIIIIFSSPEVSFNPSLAGNKMNQACKRGYLYLRSHYPLNFTSIFMKFSHIICRS